MVPRRLAPSGEPHFVSRKEQPSWEPNMVLGNINQHLVPRRLEPPGETNFVSR